jgi:hypothetical protein
MRARVGGVVAVAGALALGIGVARAQEEDAPLAAQVLESASAEDAAMRLSPAPRVTAQNPSGEHAALMDSITDEDITGAAERENRLDEARRMAPMDLLWGLDR